ncbi:Glucose dehydrogenase [acceptor] [Papilio machaon]|uniref:Glucose dehydrogenase [acceptor] n=1 Tax=Papilio machaon TaxID=76193 RepID=A0A194RES6_PAPMA|nr:Glucose dehydrogenase [acceptor] [Papilio machaon]
MDTLSSNIASACPLGFSNTGGEMFLRAVTTMIAAHCSIINNGEWPDDRTEEVIKKSNVGESYDFIIVGAGTAGTIVASQLSNINPTWSILLVEAGENPDILSEVPAFLFLNQNKKNDWKYKVKPNGKSCLAFEDNSCIWSKGKCMGGSSSINAMIYIRGHPQDFASWGKSWDYNALLPYFEKQEKYLNISDHDKVDDNKWYEIISEAWKELNYTSQKNQNYEAVIGTKRAKLLIKEGKRYNTGKVYLQRASKQMHIIKNAHVEKIIIDSVHKKAIGVRIRQENSKVFDVMASKEVVLAAGSIATPQLLMLSGIGPEHHLADKDIPCILNLPVGQNLQDHLTVPLFLKTNLDINLPSDAMDLYLLQYMLNRSGHLSTIGITDFVGFINTDNSSNQPNIQFHHMYYPKSNKISLKRYLDGVGYRKEIVDNVINLNNNYNLLGIYPTLLHPKSKGTISLRNKIPETNPVILSNYLEDPNDVQTLIKAIKFIHKLENTDNFKSLGIEINDINIKECSHHTFDTDIYWDCYIRHMGMTIFHPVGTVKMGDDDNSVVDFNLLVRGLKNLRVVDASVMPSIPGANVMAATLAIAQKAVDIIKLRYSQKEEL